MKSFKKIQIAAAVMAATAGVAVSTAQADSLLAPLVISNSGANIETYFSLRVRGSAVSDQFNVDGGVLKDTLHYTYIQKMTTADPDAGIKTTEELYSERATGGCKIQDNSGKVSSWDIVFQTASAAPGVNGSRANIGMAAPGHVAAGVALLGDADASAPNGWSAGPFYGMMIFDDVTNLAPIVGTNGRRDKEGNFTGFAYVVDADTGFVFDYKLINNSHTKRSGDFKAGYISKNSIDWMWLPVNPLGGGGVLNERTAWYTAVTGEGMTTLAENADGRWDESVLFTQSVQTGEEDILELTAKNGLPGTGAYDNDEDVVSGPQDLTVTCLGMYTRNDFLSSMQIPATINGGWKRAHIVPSASTKAGVVAHGALTYRMDRIGDGFMGTVNAPARSSIQVNIETSGHVSDGQWGSHPNRGY